MSTNRSRFVMAIVTAMVVATPHFASPNTVGADEVVPQGPVARVAHTLNPTNWKMPQFFKMPKFSGILPAREEKARIRKKKDSLVDEVSKTASRSWAKTKETLNPKNLNPIRFMPASAKKPSNQKPKEPGFFGSLFAPDPQPQRPGTVNDFLGQKKPGT